MIQIRPSQERGSADHGWLTSRHTFSFGEYHDPKHMGFRSLRVINEDRVEGGKGFGTHPHHNMEILSYVVSGELAHQDSMGNGRTIKAGELQAMSAGTGVTHSEFNPSPITPVHFLQIWIQPHTKNLSPSYSEWKPEDHGLRKGLQLLASPDGASGSVKINQDAYLHLGQFDSEEQVLFPIKMDRHLWIQVISGTVQIRGELLEPGDGAAVSNEQELTIVAGGGASILLFDLN